MFNEILTTALRLGVIDIFTVIAWESNGTTSDVIVKEIEDRVRERQAAL